MKAHIYLDIFSSVDSSSINGRVFLAALSGILLGASYHGAEYFLLPWLSMVPFLVATSGIKKISHAWLVGSIFGFFYVLVGSLWVSQFLLSVGPENQFVVFLVAITYWAVCGQSFALLAMILFYCRKALRIPLFFIFPIFSTLAFEYCISVFPASLSVTQVGVPVLIQGLDLVGNIGLTFLMMLVNALVFDSFAVSERFYSVKSMLTVSVLGAWLLYGVYALNDWDKKIDTHEYFRIGLVQSNESLNDADQPLSSINSFSYPYEMGAYESLASSGVDLVIWPETSGKGFFRFSHVRESFDFYVEKYGAPLLFQDIERAESGGMYNSSVVLYPDGSMQKYQKEKRIFLGEYLPSLFRNTFVFDIIKQFFGEFYYPLEAGVSNKNFSSSYYSWQPLICYESAFSQYVAEKVRAADNLKFISVQSKNTWFGNSIQPRLHTAVGQLRAVENRLPVVHAMNNGPSSVVSATGVVTALTEENISGGFIVKLSQTVSDGNTVFNANPSFIKDKLILIGLFVLLAAFYRNRFI